METILTTRKMVKDQGKALWEILSLKCGMIHCFNFFKWKLFEMEKHENLHADLLNMLVQHFNVTR